MSLTTNQITDILGRPPNPDETTKLSNSSIDGILAYKKSQNTPNMNMGTVNVGGNGIVGGTNTSGQNLTAGQQTQTPSYIQATLNTTTQSTPDQSQPSPYTPPQVDTTEATQAKQIHDQAVSDYTTKQQAVASLDQQINDLVKTKMAQINASGGIANEGQIRADLVTSQNNLLTLRKQAAAEQEIARQNLAQASTAYNQAANRQLQSERLAQAGQQFTEKQTQQAGQFAQKQNTADILAQAKLAQQANTTLSSDQISAIGDAIIAGTMSPVITGYSRSAPQIKAYLASKGFDAAKAEQTFKAETKYLSTLNGAKFQQLQYSANVVKDTVPSVRNAIEDWNNQVGAGLYPALNSANLLAAKNGVYGTDAQQAARNLDIWLTDMSSELSTVYKGGGTPTDKTLEQANNILNTNWDYASLKNAVDIIDNNVGIRLQAMGNTNPIGIDGSTYSPNKGGSTANLDFSWTGTDNNTPSSGSGDFNF